LFGYIVFPFAVKNGIKGSAVNMGGLGYIICDIYLFCVFCVSSLTIFICGNLTPKPPLIVLEYYHTFGILIFFVILSALSGC
jgi:hypothetical protein